MPSSFKILAILIPLVAVILTFWSFDVKAYIQRSWPLAVHPDSNAQEAVQAQLHMKIKDVPPSTHEQVPVENIISETAKAPGQFRRRIVAVGDLHGDLPNARTVLKMAGVVDDEGNWSGGTDFFVQTGDIVDRGDDTIKLYFWMDQLRTQAKQAGGTMLSHLGNHEWMNVIGDWRYVHESEIKTFGSAPARMKMITTGRIGKTWAANYTTTSRLPLHPSLGEPNTDYDPSESSPLSHAAVSFVHGGLAPGYPDLTPFPSRINELSYSLLRKLQHRKPLPAPHPPNPYPGLPEDATDAEHRLYGGDGPLWYRGWALDAEDKVCSTVDAVLKKTGTRRMIMGHTPDFERIVSRCNGKIIIIDTGISHAYGGVLSALEIEYTLTPVGENVWKEREVVTALYPDHRVLLAVDERDVTGGF